MELRRANDETSGPAIVFLPGIIMPAEYRYAPLIHELGDGIQAFTKDLEVYNSGQPANNHSIEAEVEGLATAVERAGLDRFYLYGHSGGGAVALAFVAAYPTRVLGLGLDEPASDFSESAKTTWARTLDPLKALPANERLPAFMRAQVAPRVELPAPAPGAPPDWMASRPAGIEAFINAMDAYSLVGTLSAFKGPVYYSLGSLTNPIWGQIRLRLSTAFPDFTSEEYEGLHHLNTSHSARAADVAAALRRVWRI